MFTVEIRVDNNFIKSIAMEKPQSIKDIAKKENIDLKHIVAYKKRCCFIDSNTIIEEETKLNYITSNSREGFRISQDTTLFVLVMAFNRLFGSDSELVIEHSINDGIYAEVFGKKVLTYQDVKSLDTEMRKIVAASLPIKQKKIMPDKAFKIFTKMKREDIKKNITYREMTIYECDQYYDYFIRQLSENTNIIKDFKLIFHAPGLIIRFPHRRKDKVENGFVLSKNLFKTHQEHDKWLHILGIHNVTALNRATDNYQISELIQIEEALHEKKIVNIAEQVTKMKNLKIILIAGPSSSGKTTFAKRLSIQLRVNGVNPRLIGLDDYFVSRTFTPVKENGEFDYESLKAIDLKLLNKHLTKLLKGEEIELPKYNFISGMSENSHRKMILGKNDVLILEGIHGLNDRLTSSVPFNQKAKIYVSALNNLNIDQHNRIPTTDSRKIRRIIRDNKFRGHSAEQTLEMWDSVRDGEDVNIFPFQENADFMFNSTLTYELGILKKYVMTVLQSISYFSNQFTEAQRLIKILNHIKDIDDSFVPSNSILREFIGKSVFNY